MIWMIVLKWSLSIEYGSLKEKNKFLVKHKQQLQWWNVIIKSSFLNYSIREGSLQYCLKIYHSWYLRL